MSVLKKLGQYIFVVTILYSSAISIFCISNWLFAKLFSLDDAWAEMISEIFVLIFTFPIFKLQFSMGEYIAENFEDFRKNKKFINGCKSLLVSCALIFTVFLPSHYLFNDLLFNQENEKDLSVVLAKLDSIDETENIDDANRYVLNTNTHKFHYPSCSSAQKIYTENKDYFTGTREEVISMGYNPCKRCTP